MHILMHKVGDTTSLISYPMSPHPSPPPPFSFSSPKPVVMNLACVIMHMSMPEALVAATINAAQALGQSKMHGSLEKGKWGNLLLLDAPS